jgi:hypothetical protein
VPAANTLRHAEFTTLRLGLVKVAARITETSSRVRVALCLQTATTEEEILVRLSQKPKRGPKTGKHAMKRRHGQRRDHATEKVSAEMS